MNTKIFKITLIVAALVFSAMGCAKVKADKEVMTALKAIVENCKIEVRYGWAKNCKNKEKKKFEALVKKKGQAAALGTLTVALHSKDEKLQAVACDRLYNDYRYMSAFEKNPKLLEPAVVDNMISGLGNVKGYVAFYAARSTTHAALLSGKQDALFAILDKHPQANVRHESYRNLMQHGRLKAFGKVKEIVKSGDEKSKRAASYAPRSMYKYTSGEKKEICEWGKGLLGNSDDYVAQNAASFLGMRCGSAYIDAVLAEADKRAQAGSLKPPFSYALTGFTFSCKSFLGSKPQGTPEQCKKKEDLVAQIPKKK